MESETMGRVTVTAKVENMGELLLVHKGQLTDDEVHRIEVSEALVDTGATSLSMPKSLIDRLELVPLRSRTARTSAGLATFSVYGAVRLTVQGRDCPMDVTEVPEECPVLIGQVPLEAGLRHRHGNHCIIGNPAHGGEQMFEMY